MCAYIKQCCSVNAIFTLERWCDINLNFFFTANISILYTYVVLKRAWRENKYFKKTYFFFFATTNAIAVLWFRTYIISFFFVLLYLQITIKLVYRGGSPFVWARGEYYVLFCAREIKKKKKCKSFQFV